MTVLATLLAASILSGCSDAGGPSAIVPDADPFAQPAEGVGETVLRFADLKQTVEKTVWSNGTIAFQDTCNTGACLLDAGPAMHVTDITGDVPTGVPVELAIALHYTPSPLFGTAELWIQSAESVFYYVRTTSDYATGEAVVLAMVLPRGPVEVVVFANGPGGDVPETAYSLSIGIVAIPERVSPGAPIAVELGPGSNLTFRAPGQTSPEFLLYGPDDSLIGTAEGHVSLPADAARGEYVVLVPNGAQWGNLSSDTATTMRPLGLVTEFGPEGTLEPGARYDAAWEAVGTPFAVGVFAHSDQSATPVGGPLVSLGFEVSLTGENGFAIESGPMCGLCFTFGFGVTVGSGTGDPNVVAQTYTVHGESPATYGLRLAPYAKYLDRSA